MSVGSKRVGCAGTNCCEKGEPVYCIIFVHPSMCFCQGARSQFQGPVTSHSFCRLDARSLGISSTRIHDTYTKSFDSPMRNGISHTTVFSCTVWPRRPEGEILYTPTPDQKILLISQPGMWSSRPATEGYTALYQPSPSSLGPGHLAEATGRMP